MKKFLILLLIVVAIVLILIQTRKSSSKYLVVDTEPAEETVSNSQPKESGFTLGNYKNCKIYSRSNINIPPNDLTFTDRSEVKCDIDSNNTVLFDVRDKANFEDAKNSIYQVWNDEEGYKAMIVDANGAGSGEGNGKVILLTNGTYKLISCFYYTPERFHEGYNEPFNLNKPLTAQEITSIKKDAIKSTSSYCNNFTLNNYIK